MVDAVTLVSEAMQADLNYLRSIGNNLANINSAGFKREVASTESVFEQALGGDGITQQILSPQVRVSHDLSQGTLKASDNNLNFAIEGDAYFTVSSGEQTLYTRKGEFIVDRNGRLALTSGERVQGMGGDITLELGKFSILKDGSVQQNGASVDKLKIVSIEQSLQPDYLGNGYLSTKMQPILADTQEFSVLQGYTETSNVNMQDEMIKMIELTRHFEANANILKAYDDLLDASINIVGEV